MVGVSWSSVDWSGRCAIVVGWEGPCHRRHLGGVGEGWMCGRYRLERGVVEYTGRPSRRSGVC